MTQDAEFIQKQEELKRQLATEEYKTAIDFILDGTGYLVQKFTRSTEPLSIWYIALVIALVTSVIFSLNSLLFGENFETMPHYFEPRFILTGIFLLVLVYVFMIVAKIYSGIVLATLRDNLIDAIESMMDLVDLQRWLANASNVKKPIFFSLIFGILLGFYISIVNSTILGGFIGSSSIIFNVIISFQFGLFSYYMYLFLTFSVRLGRYRLKLYAADPSSSEVIDHLSGMLSNLVYIMAGALARVTFLLAFFRFLPVEFIIIVVLVGWGPLTAFFIINQYALTRIIGRAKWKTLNEIQAKVENLYKNENIADKDTMETVKRLIDYHNQVKGTPDSALNIRSSLNFINSLLLPVLAFLLANLDKVIELF